MEEGKRKFMSDVNDRSGERKRLKTGLGREKQKEMVTEWVCSLMYSYVWQEKRNSRK